MTRPLVFDISPVMAEAEASTPSLAALALSRHWMTDPSRLAVRTDRGDMVAIAASTLAARLDARESDRRRRGQASFPALRAWLLGSGPRPEPGKPERGRVPALSWRFERPRRATARAILPLDALLLLPGLRGWAGRAVRDGVGARPDIIPVAVIEDTVWLDYPEYVPAGESETMQAGWTAMARLARAVIVPSEAARSLVEARLDADRGAAASRVAVVSPPSCLAGSVPPAFDPALAAVPFCVMTGPIESRANLAFLLNLWRDLVATGEVVPKLVLAGPRGRQIEEIKPLLDWGEAIRPHVCEAPDLAPEHLRLLLLHARALLAPGFAEPDGALVRDAQMLGVPVLASDRAVHRERLGGSAVLFSPIDGRGWREAILAMAAVPPRKNIAGEPLDGGTYADAIDRLLTTF